MAHGYAPPIEPALADADLVAAAQAGDRGALDTLLRRHQDRIHALCRRLTGNQADALDAAQEAMIAVVRGLPRFDGRSAFSTWLYRVTTNACLDELRRRRRRPTDPLPDHERADTEVVMAGGGRRRVDDEVADRLDIDHALAQLPEDFRAPVVLRDLCRLDYAEIAEVLAIPPGTVRSRISRGRAALAAHLGVDDATVAPSGNPDHPDDRPTARS